MLLDSACVTYTSIFENINIDVKVNFVNPNPNYIISVRSSLQNRLKNNKNNSLSSKQLEFED